MKVLITGAAGFVGQILAEALLNDPDARYDVTLTDIVEPPIPRKVKDTSKATCIKADLSTESASVVTPDLDVAYIFHGIMSSGAEANHELGMRVNFDSTRSLLDTMRATCSKDLKVIYTSSQAVYGGEVVLPLTEKSRATPQTSYGCEKLMCELLINDYTRRGWFNGFICRLPTVCVRAGKPTAAASSFLSGMIREPMQGIECVIPIKDRDYEHTLTSPKTLVKNLMHVMTLERDALPVYDRATNLPGIRVTVQDMMDSLARVGGEDKLKLLKEEEEDAMRAILYSWPAEFDNSLPLGLGFVRDGTFDEVVKQFRDGIQET